MPSKSLLKSQAFRQNLKTRGTRFANSLKQGEKVILRPHLHCHTLELSAHALNKCQAPSICIKLIKNKQQQFFFKKNMGSSHPKHPEQRKLKRTPTDRWTMQLSDKQNLQNEEIMPVQIVETKNFRFSKVVEASRNLMGQASDQGQPSREIDKSIFNVFQQLFEEKEEKDILVLPIIKSIIFNQALKKPIYTMIEIDPKRFITIRCDPLRLSYTVLHIIGQGSYGTVFKAESVSQKGQFRAIKQIEKSRMDNQIKLNFINEFQILKKLDHPNIIKLYEIFEDQKHYYVVSQLCDGGNLLEFINTHSLTENGIKLIMRQILGAVKYIHSLNILHRDLKFENVVVVEKNSKKVDIKIIDFGLSIALDKVVENEEIAGSLIYMAPECIEGTLCLASDIWSCGIILYMLATKKIPYKYKNDEDLIKKIEKGLISRKYLHTLKMPLKMTINFMIDKDPKRRHSADKIMQSEWLRADQSELKVSRSQRKKVAVSLFNYNIKNNLIAMIQSYISFKRIAQNERQRLAKIFEEIDKDKSGMIDIAQLKEFYAEYSENYCEKEVEELLELIDKNKSGKIDFNEFIGAIYSRRKLFEVKNLEEVFGYFDKDNSGFISKNQLKEVLIGIQDKEIEFLFLELDRNSDNMIEKSELIAYIQKQYQQ